MFHSKFFILSFCHSSKLIGHTDYFNHSFKLNLYQSLTLSKKNYFTQTRQVIENFFKEHLNVRKKNKNNDNSALKSKRYADYCQPIAVIILPIDIQIIGSNG